MAFTGEFRLFLQDTRCLLYSLSLSWVHYLSSGIFPNFHLQTHSSFSVCNARNNGHFSAPKTDSRLVILKSAFRLNPSNQIECQEFGCRDRKRKSIFFSWFSQNVRRKWYDGPTGYFDTKERKSHDCNGQRKVRQNRQSVWSEPTNTT